MTNALALWLMPPLPLRERFAELIDALSRRLGTPRFEPHITLAAPSVTTETDAISRVKQLAARLAPVPIHLIGAGHTDAYFRCLYLRAEKAAPLLAAHRLACHELDQPVETDFMPHLSLVYGTIETPLKEKIIQEIAGRFPEHFAADRLCLCVIAGSPADWRLIGPFQLTGVVES